MGKIQSVKVTGIYPAKEGLKLVIVPPFADVVSVTGIYPAKEGLKHKMSNEVQIIGKVTGIYPAKEGLKRPPVIASLSELKKLPAFIQQKKD